MKLSSTFLVTLIASMGNMGATLDFASSGPSTTNPPVTNPANSDHGTLPSALQETKAGFHAFPTTESSDAALVNATAIADTPDLYDSVLLAAFKTDNMEDRTKRELEKEGHCLYDSFRSIYPGSHALDKLTFHKETHQHVPTGDDSFIWIYFDDVVKDDELKIFIDLSEWFGPGGFLDELVLEEQAVGSKDSRRANWEREWCHCLTSGSDGFEFPVADCQLVIAPRQDLEKTKAGLLAAPTPEVADAEPVSTAAVVADTPDLYDSVLLAAFKTDNMEDRTKRELEKEGHCLYDSFRSVYPDSHALDKLTFHKETHQHVPTGDDSFIWIYFDDVVKDDELKIFIDLSEWFGPGGFLDELVLEEQTSSGLRGSKDSRRATWEHEWCHCLTSGHDALDIPVADCQLVIAPRHDLEKAKAGLVGTPTLDSETVDNKHVGKVKSWLSSTSSVA